CVILAAISEALNYHSILNDLSNFRVSTYCVLQVCPTHLAGPRIVTTLVWCRQTQDLDPLSRSAGWPAISEALDYSIVFLPIARAAEFFQPASPPSLSCP
ncbi:hypothetical protein, partial [Ottowia pentelensis]|uniref:hypothetical protein n=1 Tax=Ottowia pentelensis TaxID=511108 RepID=UPI00367022E0